MTTSPAPAATAAPGRISRPVLYGALSAALLGAVVLSLAFGEVDIAPGAIIGIVLDHLGIDSGLSFTQQQDAVLWSIRLPRVVLGAVVGAGLGIAGGALQGIFRNPLADPQLIGVSSGAALGSAVAILLLEGALGGVAGPIGGLIGGVIAGAAVYVIARHEGRTEVVTLVLAGIAVAAVAGAAAGVLSFAVRDPRLGSPLFYALGSLAVATWRLVWTTVPFVVAALLLLPLTARSLNLALLGDREAQYLGVDVERLRVVVFGLATLAAGATVAAAGVIGFVGLIAPHGVRLVAGPDHRVVLPAGALLGATLVVLADLGARTLASPIEIPVGLLTAILGGPVFLWLLARTRREHGGWG